MRDASAIELDHGGPFLAVLGDRKLWLHTLVCAGACPARHVRVVELEAGRRVLGEVELVDGALGPAKLWEPLCRVLGDDAPRLAAWAAENRDRLERRFRMLFAQRDGGPRPVVEGWKPGDQLEHAVLFPEQFTPIVLAGSSRYFIVDLHCPDRTCGCGMSSLRFVDAESGEGHVARGELGSRPASAEPKARPLWEAVRTDERLLARLNRRRAEVADFGCDVVVGYLERRRRERDGARPAMQREGGHLGAGSPGADSLGAGYLGDGASEALVARFFRAARLYDQHPAWSDFTLSVSAPAPMTAWVNADGENVFVGRAGEEEPFMEIAIAARDAVPLAARLERMGLGLPLLSLGHVPWVAGEGDVERAPRPDELRLAAAVLEAIANLEAAQHEDEAAVQVSLETDIDGVVFRARLAYDEPTEEPRHAREASAQDGDEAEMHDELEDTDAESGDDDGATDEDDDWEDDEGDDEEPDEDAAHSGEDGDVPRFFCDAIVDHALSAGRDPAVADWAGQLLSLLASAREHEGLPFKTGLAWIDARLVRSLFRTYGPRKVSFTGEDLEHLPEATLALAAFLEEAGYLDGTVASAVRAEVRASTSELKRRAKDPANWGMAKAFFADALARDLDLSDRATMDAYVAEKNAARAGKPTSEPAVSGPARVRWSLGAGDAVPEDKAPCPCGSGRRYKKCCKPR